MHTAPAWNDVIAGGRVLSGGQLAELDDGVPRVKAGGHARSELDGQWAARSRES